MSKVPMNIPNILTFFRFILIIPAVIFSLQENYLVGLVLFLVACITDLLDGYIARKYDQVSNAGIILDPLADKLMAVSMTIVFTVNGVYPLWVSIIIFVKEAFMIIGGGIMLLKKLIMPSNLFGKISAFAFNFALAIAFLNKYIAPYYLWVMYAALGMMVLALLQYAYKNFYKKYLLKRKELNNGAE